MPLPPSVFECVMFIIPAGSVVLTSISSNFCMKEEDERWRRAQDALKEGRPPWSPATGVSAAAFSRPEEWSGAGSEEWSAGTSPRNSNLGKPRSPLRNEIANWTNEYHPGLYEQPKASHEKSRSFRGTAGSRRDHDALNRNCFILVCLCCCCILLVH